jgi:hypothetical protein
VSIEEEVRMYLANRWRCWQLGRLEKMASRPTLAARRKVRPRVGAVRRVIRWLIGA